ncbi:unnamed protein product [Bemisia tabaci]|uniref:Ribosome production factor 2 homolog n=1 Tax=Bemisia tabaci TaxID=7038 RepID=A0A9P0F6T3_BEMTA|nr:PREDICTED: ribosome production factor 2 homolog [Bemisia tabaci]CAH0390353.1 unnamed protein product [Bemisia tabaci]
MPFIQRVKRPVTAKGRRILLKKQPRFVEFPKQTMYVRGKKANALTMDCMKEIYQLKKPGGLLFTKKHDILPFENVGLLENYSQRRGASLFIFASSNKKHPHSLIFGRTHDHQLLDMVELEIEAFKSIKEFKTEHVAVGLKPCILFAGEDFQTSYDHKRIQNLLVDMFQREVVTDIRLQGLEHVIMFTAADDKIFLRNYRVQLKKSGSRIPRVELEEIGPAVDFRIGRKKLATEDLFKSACKQPTSIDPKPKKNIRTDAFGSKLGRVHMTKQDVNSLQTRKMKGLKKSYAERKEQRSKKKSASK